MLPRSLSLVVRFAPAVLAVAVVAPAHADVSKKVIAACKGRMLIGGGPLATDEKGTIADCKKKATISVQGAQNGNDVQEWTFSYTAFLGKTGATTLKLEFHDGDKYSADSTLTGIDPKDPVLEGDITIDEDEGLTKGKTYTLKLVGRIKGRETTVSTAVVTLK
jgi:hypothetical protein